jgi:hypothetical protein
MGPVSIQSNGDFEFSGVYPGSYHLTVFSGRSVGDVPVVVERRDISNITVPMPDLVSLKGTVNIAQPLLVKPPFLLRLVLTSDPQGNSYNFRIQEPGSFELPNIPPGNYFIEPQLADDNVADIHQGVRNIDGDGKIAISQSSAPIEINLRPGEYGTVEGVVRSSQGRTYTSQVILIPELRLRQNPNLYKMAQTDESGKFRLESVVPGEYRLLGWEVPRLLGIDPTSPPDTLVIYERYGIPLTVRPKQTVQAEVPAIPH